MYATLFQSTAPVAPVAATKAAGATFAAAIVVSWTACWVIELFLLLAEVCMTNLLPIYNWAKLVPAHNGRLFGVTLHSGTMATSPDVTWRASRRSQFNSV